MTNSGGIVNMEVCLLDTLAMIALGIRQTEQAFFQEITKVRQYQYGVELTEGGINSCSFQKANAMFCRPCVSETPAIPSSPHLKALDRACPWGKSARRLA